MFLHFAERGARQRCDGHEGAGDFEGRKLVAAEGFERGGVSGAHDIGHWDFATHAIGHGDDGGFGDAGLPGE